MSKERSEVRTETKETTSGTRNQVTRSEPTPEERELNKLTLAERRAVSPNLIAAQKRGLELVEQLLSGSEDLPGFFTGLQRGISPEITRQISQEAVADIAPSFQSSGLLDSGVRASVSGRIAGDIRRSSEEFNIGNRLNLLNLALSGQAQVQAPVLGFSTNLSNRLSGLRTVSSSGSFSQVGTGSSNQTTLAPNPFLSNFQRSLGNTLGSPSFSAGPFSF